MRSTRILKGKALHPKWTHDCEACEYIGSMHSDRGLLDWYTCNDSVIARYGDDGPEYWSTPRFIINNDDYLIGRDMYGNNGVGAMLVLARYMTSL